MNSTLQVIAIIFCGYYLITTSGKYAFYRVAIFLYLVASIGNTLKIMRYPGADYLLAIGLLSSILAAVLLIRNGIQIQEFRTIRLLLAALMIIQLLLVIPYSLYGNWNFLYFGKVLSCVIFLCAGWIIVKKTAMHEGELNLVTIILIQSILAIISLLKVTHVVLSP